MNALRPIEIVGGGLAGLSLGGALCRAGVSVRLLEAGTYPRHRVCGEFITGLTVRTRATLDLERALGDAVQNWTVAWFSGDRRVRVHRLPQAALGLSRHALDERLARAFRDAGGVLVTSTRARSAVDTPGRVYASGRRRSPSSWLGLKLHATDLMLAHDLEVHLGRQAYVGVARVERGRVNVCGLFQRRSISAKGADLLAAYLQSAGLGALAARLDAAQVDPSSFSAVAAVDFDGGVRPTREVRIGDACAVIAPFTGHGMAMAFESAEIALAPLMAYARGEAEWPEVRERIGRALRRRFRLRLASAQALHPFLLRPAGQRCLALVSRCRILPMRALYAALH